MVKVGFVQPPLQKCKIFTALASGKTVRSPLITSGLGLTSPSKINCKFKVLGPLGISLNGPLRLRYPNSDSGPLLKTSDPSEKLNLEALVKVSGPNEVTGPKSAELKAAPTLPATTT
jgi:hypothetical protein